MIDLYTDGLEDRQTKEALTDLVESLNKQPFLMGKWTFITLKISNVEVTSRPTYLITEDLLSLILCEDGSRILV